MKTEAQNQNTELLHYLKMKGTINPMEALDQLSIYRLAARIADLRKEHNIKTLMISDFNKEGKKVRYAKYIYLGKK